MTRIKKTIVALGEDPFSYESLEVIAKNDYSILEKVRSTGFRRHMTQLLRKTKKVKGSEESRRNKDVDFQKLQELQKREADFLISTNHPAFPKAYGYFNGSIEDGPGIEGGWVTSLVREYVPGKSLDDVIEASGIFNPEKAVDYAIQISEGLRELHGRGFLFRDLKPSNMILKERSISSEHKYGQIKLTD